MFAHGDEALQPNEDSIHAEELEAILSQAGSEFGFSPAPSSNSFTPLHGVDESSISSLERHQSSSTSKSSFQEGQLPLPKVIAHTYDDAVLFRHYTSQLGRWLDCTDVSRHFTLVAPVKAKQCPILYHAILCFTGRHRREYDAAEAQYLQAISLLIGRLNDASTSHDETLLSAVLILHFADQLDVPSHVNSEDKQHLAGSSSILRASQGGRPIDPSTPTLREAAFWVYVRQCLYNAIIRQQPLDLDLSLQIDPTPYTMQYTHSLDWVRLETAWGNQIVWETACVANFCFRGTEIQSGSTPSVSRVARWQTLWAGIQRWHNTRPKTFDPIGAGISTDGSVFPDILFTIDCHGISYAFYHVACILLLTYEPDANFAVRGTHGKLSQSGARILDHARAICSACKSSPDNAQIQIVLCSTIFIWGPLLFDPGERNELIDLLRTFEQKHLWRTSWMVAAIKAEWAE